MGHSEPKGDASQRTASNRFGRSPEEIEDTRARIADAKVRAEKGELRDSTEWARQKLEEERRRLTAR